MIAAGVVLAAFVLAAATVEDWALLALQRRQAPRPHAAQSERQPWPADRLAVAPSLLSLASSLAWSGARAQGIGLVVPAPMLPRELVCSTAYVQPSTAPTCRKATAPTRNEKRANRAHKRAARPLRSVARRMRSGGGVTGTVEILRDRDSGRWVRMVRAFGGATVVGTYATRAEARGES